MIEGVIVAIDLAEDIDNELMELLKPNATKWGYLTSIDGNKAFFKTDSRSFNYLNENYTIVTIEVDDAFWFNNDDLGL